MSPENDVILVTLRVTKISTFSVRIEFRVLVVNNHSKSNALNEIN